VTPHAQRAGLDAGAGGELADRQHSVVALASHSGFTKAYRAHRHLAFSSAHRVLGDAAAAEDVVHDVFSALWRDPSKFDSRRGSLPGYVAMMARSRAVDRVRSRNASAAAVDRLAVRDADRDVAEDSPAERVVSRDETGRILAVVGELPPAQRDAILLAYGRGLTTVEVARAAAVPVGTAKSRLRLGRQRTRQMLAAAPDATAA
jgi:RNA polymerase sigma-70 factor, ECF subfamily